MIQKLMENRNFQFLNPFPFLRFHLLDSKTKNVDNFEIRPFLP